MTYEKRANCLALSFATLILISIISEFAGWQHTVLWRGASTVIMQFLLLAYAILAIRDNKRGGAIIRASVTPSRNIFLISERPVILYVLSAIIGCICIYALTGNLDGLLIECAPLPYVLFASVIVKASKAIGRLARLLLVMLYLTFTLFYVALLVLSNGNDVILSAIALTELCSVIIYCIYLIHFGRSKRQNY